jgi:hypothetical protein
MIGTCNYCEEKSVKLFAPFDHGKAIYCSDCQELAESAEMDEMDEMDDQGDY